MSMILSQEIIRTCKMRLLSMKQELLNRARTSRMEFAQNDKNSGDEIDQAVAQLTENSLLASQERIRVQLFEIEMALSRIQAGQFGFCEETGEQIEEQRLLAIPYTRLSIEGAELRESLSTRFATP
ncbi:MAG: TraR/DksA family transcriptional regulator [Proteobacteria bacterium]|jgi:DnaK suppressor protein|nr:TraR/DksA family transcriptional regulator [Pseudomonadota bacterium]